MVAVNALSRALGRGQGTVAGGRVAQSLCPSLLRELLGERDLALVSGTNGKTTTTSLLRHALGATTVSNETGSNMPAGWIAALGHRQAGAAVLEVDESYLGTALEASGATRRRIVVLLNLSRDQLDRASEVRQVAQRWKSALSSDVAADVVVVANVNDPLVAWATSDAPHLIACAVPTPWLLDAQACPRCARLLSFDALGDWSCVCGLRRPDPEWSLDGERLAGPAGEYELHLDLPGSFNVANAALAIAGAYVWGIDAPDSVRRIHDLRDVAGRFEVRTWRGREIRLNLAKNPAGVAALLQGLGGSGDVVVSINARDADGHDPSWIYDAPFEALSGRRVWVDGDRALDVATRLQYGGLDVLVARDNADFAQVISGTGPIEVIANYTAFREWRKRSHPC
jgi:UDP-N-acetylmuramyl tripeptide synthase